MPKPYPPDFRRRVLDLVISGRTVRDVAASLGIAESCLYGWKSRDLIDRGLKPGTTTTESAELAAAHRRIRGLEEENKFLRKAAAAVEQVVPPKGRYQLVAELERISGPDLASVLAGERGEGQDLAFGGVHQRADLGVAGGRLVADLVPGFVIEARSGWAKMVRNTAATISTCALGTCARTLRMRCTRQRWWAAP